MVDSSSLDRLRDLDLRLCCPEWKCLLNYIIHPHGKCCNQSYKPVALLLVFISNPLMFASTWVAHLGSWEQCLSIDVSHSVSQVSKVATHTT